MDFLPCHSHHRHCHCCRHYHHHCHDLRDHHRYYNPTTVLAPSIAVTTILTSVAFKCSHHCLHPSFSFFLGKWLKCQQGFWVGHDWTTKHSTTQNVSRVSQVARVVKNLPANAGDAFLSVLKNLINLFLQIISWLCCMAHRILSSPTRD